VRIAVDAMGGDQGPRVVVPGALEAVRRGPAELEVILVGQEDRIRAELPPDAQGQGSLRVVHASEVIGMSEPPASAFRKKKDSSIAVATRLVRDGEADGFVSAGNTGAVVASSLVNMGRLHGVSRPAISTLWPSARGGAVVLDVGANYECVPKNLVQFAIMGSVFARFHLGIDAPRVGLLNIGEERSKGNDLVRESYPLMENEPSVNFVGNVEGRDVFNGAADVVVCDGFVGNVILKFSESIFSFLTHMVKDEIRKGVVAKAGAFLMKGAFSNVRTQLDYAEYGGAPLLGVKGVTIISHGKSEPRAIKNAILAAANTVTAHVNDHIEERFRESAQHVAKVS
jgi:glycerol-3-phosphate acyltransferase PlsX